MLHKYKVHTKRSNAKSTQSIQPQMFAASELDSCLAFSCPAISCPANALQIGPSISCPAFSCPSFSAPPSEIFRHAI